MKTLFTFVITLMVSACTQSSSQNSRSLALNARADLGEVEHTVVASGALISRHSSPLIVQRVQYIWEYTVAWTAEEGKFVKKGDVVLRLDPASVQKELDAARLSYDKAKLKLQEDKLNALDRVADAKAEIETNELNLKKQKLLVVNSDTISAVEHQKQLLEVASAETALKRSRAKLLSTRDEQEKSVKMQSLSVDQEAQNVKELEDGLQKLEVRAPQDGILIFSLFSRQGSWYKARPGVTVNQNTVVGEIADPSSLIVKTFIPEVDADGLATGAGAQISLEISPTVFVTGKIEKISSLASTQAEREGSKSSDPFQNVRQFECLVAIDTLPSNAMPGMSAIVKIQLEKKTNVLRIPIDFLTTEKASPKPNAGDKEVAEEKESSGGKHYFVNMREKNSDWKWQEVDVGTIGTGYVEITKGLAVGNELKLPKL